VIDGVAFKEMEGVGETREERRFEVGVEVTVEFDGPEIGAGFEDGGGERAESGADLDDGVTGAHAGEFEGFKDDVAVHEEVLPERALGKVAELAEEIAGGGGRKRHGRS
jgi:hypothetical protein